MQIMSVAASGMDSQTAITASLANNVANANTTGYKQSMAYITDAFYTDIRLPSVQTVYDYPNALQFGNGSQVTATLRNFQQGTLKPTGNEFNIAIVGQGFLGVNMPDGQVGYTRDGTLMVDGNTNQLITATGFPVQPNITLPPPNARRGIVINRAGLVSSVNLDGTTTAIGQLTLFVFNNNQGLVAAGENVYFATEASGPAMQGQPAQNYYGLIQQGHLELSNANPIMNITDLIASLRIYEMNARILRGGDSMLRTVVDVASA